MKEYILYAGVNGAGKSTLYNSYLNEKQKEDCLAASKKWTDKWKKEGII